MTDATPDLPAILEALATFGVTATIYTNGPEFYGFRVTTEGRNDRYFCWYRHGGWAELFAGSDAEVPVEMHGQLDPQVVAATVSGLVLGGEKWLSDRP